MAVKTSTSRRRKVKSKARKRLNLQKPSGVIGPRVAKVGGDRFAIVCVDPAKHRSEWIMADYFGNLLIEQQTLEHQAAFFKLAVELVNHTRVFLIRVKGHDAFYRAINACILPDFRAVIHRSGNISDH